MRLLSIRAMLKTGRFIVIAGLMLCGDRPLRAQLFGPPGPVPPEMAEMPKAQARLMREAAPAVCLPGETAGHRCGDWEDRGESYQEGG